MRVTFLFIILISPFGLKAQTALPLPSAEFAQRGIFLNSNHSFDTPGNKKWFLSSYSAISTSFAFFNGGSATVLSAPVGLQLNRRLNNNLYAFAGISVAPAYVNFNSSFLSSDVNKFYPGSNFYNSNNLGLYSRAEMGLMYVNDARTFSISGSFSVQRGSYPIFSHQQLNTSKQNNLISGNR
ncbi:MAG TPA: hypothetical protein VKT28_05550 [Puia sp.]|nr:hypothetical protein [Puia sp.]